MTLLTDLAAVLPRLGDGDIARFCAFHETYAPHFDEISSLLYERLPAADRERFVLWMLKRWAKIDLVNPIERHLYDATIHHLRHEERPPEELDGRTYRLRDMRAQGYDFRMLGYDWWLGAHDIRYGQYEHGDNGPRPDDVIIDAGAFIGDTAVYFHHKLQGQCHVHSFELLDENLALLVHNLERNGVADDRVTVNRFALADRTGDEITIADGATQGSTSIFGRSGRGAVVQTITLDDYVMSLGLQRVDFIKMDIEGAEVPALKGATQTIRHFRPRLAICLYHQWDDVVRVPRVLREIGVPYRYGFKWVQLKDGWEAILHAVPMEPGSEAGAGALAPAARTADPMAEAFAALCQAYRRRAKAAPRPAAVDATKSPAAPDAARPA